MPAQQEAHTEPSSDPRVRSARRQGPTRHLERGVPLRRRLGISSGPVENRSFGGRNPEDSRQAPLLLRCSVLGPTAHRYEPEELQTSVHRQGLARISLPRKNGRSGGKAIPCRFLLQHTTKRPVVIPAVVSI